MSLVVIAAFVVACITIVTLALLQLRRPPRDVLVREHLLDRYVITLLSGESFAGLLSAVDDRTLVLRDAEVLSANSAKADGDVVLRRESVAYMQRPT